MPPRLSGSEDVPSWGVSEFHNMSISWDNAAERLSAVQKILNDTTMAPVSGPVHVGVDLGTTDVVAGGTCCLPNLQPLLEKEMGLPVTIPIHPLLLTPLSIACLSLHPLNNLK